jgi:ABC-type glycerol-3-phosphate transport system permease component
MAATAHKPRWLTTLSFAFIAIWMLLAAFPFLWTVWGSFKVQGDFFSKLDWMNAILGTRTIAETGGYFTGRGYSGAWIENEFWRAAINTGIVTVSVVVISLTLGTLGGYALSRSS